MGMNDGFGYSCDGYMIGVYDLKSDTFIPDTVLDDLRLWPRIDYGNFYASNSFFDSKKGRRIIWGWTNEAYSSSDDVAKAWAGIHAIPRTIWLDSHGKKLLNGQLKRSSPFEEMKSTIMDKSLRREVYLRLRELTVFK